VYNLSLGVLLSFYVSLTENFNTVSGVD